MARTREYRSWLDMIQCCTNPGSAHWRDYGGRGITVCQRWRDDFTAFYQDMGPRPDGMRLVRESHDSNFEPGKVRWGTPAESMRIRRPRVHAKWLRALSDEQVRELRKRYAAGGITQAHLAASYGVSVTTVKQAVRGLGAYAHL
jgi:hypothetical protein